MRKQKKMYDRSINLYEKYKDMIQLLARYCLFDFAYHEFIEL